MNAMPRLWMDAGARVGHKPARMADPSIATVRSDRVPSPSNATAFLLEKCVSEVR